MTVHYISDLHLDFYKEPNKPLDRFLEKFTKNIKPEDVLIIAGDTSHYNLQSVQAFKYFSNFCEVLFVTGNHEFYNVSKNMKSKYTKTYDRFNELKELTKPLENIHMLDGTIKIINDVKFGGAMGWYDGSYTRKLNDSPYAEDIMSLWYRTMNDSRLVPELSNFYNIFNIEIIKIKDILSQEPDIMVSHFCPISESLSFEGSFKNDPVSGFYAFDCPAQGLKMPPKWIYGHMHTPLEFEFYGSKYYRNPMGYPRQNPNITLKSFEV